MKIIMFLWFGPYLPYVRRFCATAPKSYFFLCISCCALSPALSLGADSGVS